MTDKGVNWLSKQYSRFGLALAKVGLIAVLWHIAFRAGQQIPNLLWYMQHAPNCYRLWDQFLIFFHDRPFSYVTLASTIWALSILGTWLMIRPDEMDTLAFIIGAVSASAYFYIRQGPQYLLLAVLVVSGSPAVLLLLVPVKEYAVIVGVLYLLVYRRNSIRYTTVLWVALAGVFYLSIFYIIGPVSYTPAMAPMVTVQYMLAKLLADMVTVLIKCIPILAMLVLVARKRKDALFLSLCGVFIFAFGLFWEVHLWLTPAVVVMAERKAER